MPGYEDGRSFLSGRERNLFYRKVIALTACKATFRRRNDAVKIWLN